MKGILNESYPVSQRPDFIPVENMYRPNESLRWDGNVPGIIYNGNDHALLALSTLESLNVDDDFLSQLKGVYFSRSSFSRENIDRRKKHKIEKSIQRVVPVSQSYSDPSASIGFNYSVAN
jgi:hypothetical protein